MRSTLTCHSGTPSHRGRGLVLLPFHNGEGGCKLDEGNYKYYLFILLYHFLSMYARPTFFLLGWKPQPTLATLKSFEYWPGLYVRNTTHPPFGHALPQEREFYLLPIKKSCVRANTVCILKRNLYLETQHRACSL